VENKKLSAAAADVPSDVAHLAESERNPPVTDRKCQVLGQLAVVPTLSHRTRRPVAWATGRPIRFLPIIVAAIGLMIAQPTPATDRERLAAMLTGNQGGKRGRETDREAEP